MARTTPTVAFNAIEVKGSLIPDSLLDQVARFKAKQQDPRDYGLEKNERLRDQIDAAWVTAKDLWAEYTALKERAGQGVAALHFSLRMLREVFGWTDLQPVAGWQQGDRNYPITHRAFSGTVPLILKGVETGKLDTWPEDVRSGQPLALSPQLPAGMPQCRRQLRLGAALQRRSAAASARQPLAGQARLSRC